VLGCLLGVPLRKVACRVTGQHEGLKAALADPIEPDDLSGDQGRLGGLIGSVVSGIPAAAMIRAASAAVRATPSPHPAASGANAQ
jgi:hypothetical protein